MQIERTETIGALIGGVDINTMDDATWRKIYQTWLECNVIAVRDQTLTMPQFLAYSRRFGVVSPHPSKSTRDAQYPEITVKQTRWQDGHVRLRRTQKAQCLAG